MEEASLYFGGRRRNHGWLYVLDEDLELIAAPSVGDDDALPDDVGSLVRTAAFSWSKQAWRRQLVMMLSPTLTARVFPLHGPGGTCIVVYLERFRIRVGR